MRDRLIELIDNWYTEYFNIYQECNDENASIADYLLENGVVASPCKVGDPVWLVYTPKWPADPADKGKWFMIEDGVQRIIYGAKGLSIETWNMGTIPESKFGVKLFFTKEQAEKALAEVANGT